MQYNVIIQYNPTNQRMLRECYVKALHAMNPFSCILFTLVLLGDTVTSLPNTTTEIPLQAPFECTRSQAKWICYDHKRHSNMTYFSDPVFQTPHSPPHSPTNPPTPHILPSPSFPPSPLSHQFSRPEFSTSPNATPRNISPLTTPFPYNTSTAVSAQTIPCTPISPLPKAPHP